MRPNNPILLHVPSLLVQRLDVYLKDNPPNFQYKLDYFYYVVHYITSLQLMRKDKEYVIVNRKILKDLSVSNIGSYIRILENGEFIISDKSYVTGKKSKGYKLNKKYSYGLETIEISKDCKLFDKIIKHHRRKRAHKDRLEPFLQQMNKTFMDVELDYSKAEKWILCNVPNNKQHFHFLALTQLKDKRFRHFHRNKTNNRLDTNLTNLKSELRQFIKGDFISIDLKNSQPFLLSVLLNSIINNSKVLLCSINNDLDLNRTFGVKAIQKILKNHQKLKKSNLVNLKKFTDAVLNGNLYEDFIKSYSNKIKRKKAKDIMFKVLFSKNEIYHKYKRFVPYNEEKEIFASVFPFVMESVKALKEKEHSGLAIFLQKLESYVFIDCIAKRLVEAGIVPLTIHDSFLIESKYKDKAMEIIHAEFLGLFGVVPSFHVESNSKEVNLRSPQNNTMYSCHLKKRFIQFATERAISKRIA